MKASALRRDFKTRVNSSDEFISSSIACRRRSWDPAEFVSMKVTSRGGRNGTKTVFKWQRRRHNSINRGVHVLLLLDIPLLHFPVEISCRVMGAFGSSVGCR